MKFFSQTDLNFHTVVCMATYLLMMCQSHYPTVFLGRKTVRMKIWYLAPKFYSLFLVSTRNDNISRGEGGGPFCELILENLEGRGAHR